MIIAYSLYNLFLAVFSKKVFDSWFNPVSLYVIVWEIAMGIHQSGLIVFYPLSWYTWFIIFLMQSLFACSCFLGSRMGVVIEKRSIKPRPSINEKKLKDQIIKYIIITTVFSSISIISQLIGTIARYGTNLLDNVTNVYAARVYNQDTIESIPYVGAFIYIALPLVGIYIKKYGFNLLTLPAIALVFLNSLTSGGRAGIVFSMVLMASAYLVTDSKRKVGKKVVKNRRLLISLGVLILLTMVITISIKRNAGQSLIYANQSFYSLFGQNLLLYKTFSYIAGPIGVLNEYLKESELHFGQNTLLTVYNFLYRIGVLDQRIEQYQEWFYTPLGCNVGTWIRELIEDFTVFGAIVCVPLFGYCTTRTYMYSRNHNSVSAIVLWSILSLVLLLSFFDWKLRSSNIWISLLFGYIFSRQIDIQSRKNAIVEITDEQEVNNGRCSCA